MSPSDPPPSAPDPLAGIDRRALLRGAAATSAAATIAGFWFEGFGNPLRRRWLVQPTPAGAPGRTFDAEQWTVLEAALDRLLPSEPEAPGARDVNAVGYLDAVLTEPDFPPAAYADVVKAGVPRLTAGARARGAPSFPALAGEGQDAVLTSFEADAEGLRWLKRMLYFALEALLGDPVHGCQPGEVGWKWLNNAPLDPRPTVPGWKPPLR